MADGTDGADAFSGLVAYARACGVKPKMASAASVASGFLRPECRSRGTGRLAVRLGNRKVLPAGRPYAGRARALGVTSDRIFQGD